MSHLNPQSPPPKKKVDALVNSLDQLQQAVAADGAGREGQWAETVGNVLDHLVVALRQHRAAARRPDGPLAEVDETRPTLARQADELRSDYDHSLRQLLGLREQVRRTAEAFTHGSGRTTSAVMDIGTIRQQAEQLLVGLQQDREAEMKLVLESVNTDIGAGD